MKPNDDNGKSLTVHRPNYNARPLRSGVQVILEDSMASQNKNGTFNGNPIDQGDFLLIECDTDVFRWVIVNNVEGPGSVQATILEQGGARYPQGRSMVIYLKYARDHRSKDKPPPLWSTAHAA